MQDFDIVDTVARTLASRELAGPENPVLLMVSGGSDSTALAYIAAELLRRECIGPLAMLHVNHQLRGDDSEADAAFSAELAALLEIPFFLCEIDIAGMVRDSGDNMEAVARRERYIAADEALESLCLHSGYPVAAGRIFTAHTQDDRVESFYMRSIVGTGPGGFRGMRYANGRVVRPCLDVSREDLRDYLQQRALEADAGSDCAVVRDALTDGLWREDATNAHTDRFRAFVRHEIVPLAKQRNPQLLDTLCRTMNTIADEDDLMESGADDVIENAVEWQCVLGVLEVDYAAGCLLLPEFGTHPVPLQRRAAYKVLQLTLGADARVEQASVQAVVDGFREGSPVGGYTHNIQGDLALSANKAGLRIEPMAAYRSRRKRK